METGRSKKQKDNPAPPKMPKRTAAAAAENASAPPSPSEARAHPLAALTDAAAAAAQKIAESPPSKWLSERIAALTDSAEALFPRSNTGGASADSGGDTLDAAALTMPKNGFLALNEPLRSLIEGVASGALSGLLAFGEMPLGSHPFGLASLAAAEKYIPYRLVGLLVSAVFSGSFGGALGYAGSALAALGMRILLCRWYEGTDEKAASEAGISSSSPPRPLFREPVALRVTAGLVACFFGGMYRVIRGGFLYYDLGGAIAEMAGVGLSAVLFSAPLGAAVTALPKPPSASEAETPSEGTKKPSEIAAAGRSWHDAGTAALIFAAVFSLRALNIFGFSAATVTAGIMTLCAAGGGLGRGAVVGLLGGLASAGITASAPMTATAMALSAIAASAARKVSLLASVIAAAAVTGCVCALGGGFDALRAVLPDMIAAGVIFYPTARYSLLPKIKFFSADSSFPENVAAACLISSEQQRRERERLGDISESMDELGRLCRRVSAGLRRPSQDDLRVMVSEAFRVRCRGCPRSPQCYGKGYRDTADAITALSAALAKSGRISSATLPRQFAARCPASGELISALRSDYSRLRSKLIAGDRSEDFASDCVLLSEILKEAADGRESEYVRREDLSECAAAAVSSLDISCTSVGVYGQRRLKILAGGMDTSRMRVGAETLRKAFAAECGRVLGKVSFSPPSLHFDDDYVSMTLERAPIFSVECVCRTQSGDCTRRSVYVPGGTKSDGGKSEDAPPRVAESASVRRRDRAEVCGDTALRFSDGDDREYFLISDGMGSGEEAALTSRLCAVFLQKLIGSGVSGENALNFLGSFLRGRGTAHEISATVDLLGIDLLDGSARFLKSGAVPSYILRGDSLYEITSRTLPLGIISPSASEEISFSLREGDIIAMVSDGIASGHESDPWLAELLCSSSSDPLDSIAEKILSHSPKTSDDLSVVLIRLSAV